LLIPIKMPEPENEALEPGSQANSIKRRLLGAAVLIALGVIFLPLLLDGPGSESRFRRVEKVREYPPRIIGADGVPETRQIADTRPAPPKPETRVVIDTTKPPPVKALAEKPVAVEPVVDARPVVEPPQPEPAPTQTASRNNPSAAIDDALVKLGEREAGVPAIGSAEPATRYDNDEAGQIAWVIQAGSFGEVGNAVRLRDQLRSRGYPSFVTTSSDGQGTGAALHRVKVGPVADRQKAERQKREIERITGRSSLLREYR